MLPVTSVCAVVLTAMFCFYSTRIIGLRRALRVAVFDGGDVRLGRMIRAQGNLLEYGLLFVMLVGLSEAAGVPWWWLALLAAVFFVGRVCHGYGLSVAEPDEARGDRRFRWRFFGMVATLNCVALAAATLVGALIWAAVAAL